MIRELQRVAGDRPEFKSSTRWTIRANRRDDAMEVNDAIGYVARHWSAVVRITLGDRVPAFLMDQRIKADLKAVPAE